MGYSSWVPQNSSTATSRQARERGLPRTAKTLSEYCKFRETQSRYLVANVVYRKVLQAQTTETRVGKGLFSILMVLILSGYLVIMDLRKKSMVTGAVILLG